MKCPYMTGTYMFSCVARREVYIPSAFEFSEYCGSDRSEGFKVCPLYMGTPKASPGRPAVEAQQSQLSR